MDRPYATPEGVRSYLTSLQGLHALRADRRAAAARHESLPGFCVLGDYILTEDGRFGELTGISARFVLDLPDVVALDEFERRGRRIYKERWRLSYKTPAALAPYDGLCPECGRGWTYSDRSDVVDVWDRCTVLADDGPVGVTIVRHLHARCHEIERARDALWWAEDALERAGFPDAAPEPCRAPEGGFGAWFRQATPAGPIRFGPRGPGIAIDWTETGRDLTGTFCRIEAMSCCGPVWNEPPVPHGPFHVDPKDGAWFIRYLERLHSALWA
jgi:hypothetical protein